jgi:hypothetical protein
MHGEFMASIFVKAPVSCISKAVAVLFRRCHIYACTMFGSGAVTSRKMQAV